MGLQNGLTRNPKMAGPGTSKWSGSGTWKCQFPEPQNTWARNLKMAWAWNPEMARGWNRTTTPKSQTGFKLYVFNVENTSFSSPFRIAGYSLVRVPCHFRVPGPGYFGVPGPGHLGVPGPGHFGVLGPGHFGVSGPGHFGVPGAGHFGVPGACHSGVPGHGRFGYPGPWNVIHGQAPVGF